jgi:hypothetical protein
MSKVFIVNKSFHDFDAAKRHGEVIYLSDGPMGRYETNNIARQFEFVMKDSKPDDYIVPCSLNVMNSIACSMFSVKHKRLNLLLWRDGRYIERSLIFDYQKNS